MDYHEEQKKNDIKKLRDLQFQLPEFCFEYFRGIEPTTAEKTRLGYAHDLRIFFSFLLEYVPSLSGKTIHDITLEDLDAVSASRSRCFSTTSPTMKSRMRTAP